MSTAPHSRVALELPLCVVITSGCGVAATALELPLLRRGCYAGATLGALGAVVGAGGGSGVQQTVAVRQMTCEVAPPSAHRAVYGTRPRQNCGQLPTCDLYGKG